MADVFLDLLAVAVGGAVGAVVRWCMAGLNRPGRWTGTLLANVMGTLLLVGLLTADIGDQTLLLLGTGVAGGLTTFSTLMVEVADLRPPPAQRVEDRPSGASAAEPSGASGTRRVAYMTVSLVLGVGAAIAGLVAG